MAEKRFINYTVLVPESVLKKAKELSAEQEFTLPDFMTKAVVKGVMVEEQEAEGMDNAFIDPESFDHIFLNDLLEASEEQERTFDSPNVIPFERGSSK